MDVLDGLPVLVENIHPHHRLVELWVGALDEFIVQVLLVIQRVEPLEHEVEEGVEVLRAWRGDEDIGVAEADGRGDGEAEGGGLAAAPRRRQGHRAAQSLLRDGLHELEQALGLVEGPRSQNQGDNSRYPS